MAPVSQGKLLSLSQHWLRFARRSLRHSSTAHRPDALGRHPTRRCVHTSVPKLPVRSGSRPSLIRREVLIALVEALGVPESRRFDRTEGLTKGRTRAPPPKKAQPATPLRLRAISPPFRLQKSTTEKPAAGPQGRALQNWFPASFRARGPMARSARHPSDPLLSS